jgi:hypothetical protein
VASWSEECDGGQGCSTSCSCVGDDYIPLIPPESNCGLVSKMGCRLGDYEVVAPTESSSRVCAPIRTCLSSQWETQSPTSFRDRLCDDVTVCGPNQYSVVTASRTSDAECADVGVCDNLSYTSVAATGTSDRTCSLLTSCQDDQYESRPPTATSDRQCRNISLCVDGIEYEVGLACSLVTSVGDMALSLGSKSIANFEPKLSRDK